MGKFKQMTRADEEEEVLTLFLEGPNDIEKNLFMGEIKRLRQTPNALRNVRTNRTT